MGRDLRRTWIRVAAYLTLALANGVSYSSEESSADLVPLPEAISLYHAGKVDSARKALKTLLDQAHRDGTFQDQYAVIEPLLDLCTATYDHECILEYLPFLSSLEVPQDGTLDENTVAYIQQQITEKAQFYATYEIWLGMPAEGVRTYVPEAYLGNTWNPAVNPLLYIRRELLLGNVLRTLERPGDAVLALDRAWTTILSLEKPIQVSWWLTRWVEEISYALYEAGDVRSALAIYNMAKPFMDAAVPPNSFERVLFSIYGAELEILSNRPKIAWASAQRGLEILDGLEISQGQKFHLEIALVALKGSSCLFEGDSACMIEALENSSFYRKRKKLNVGRDDPTLLGVPARRFLVLAVFLQGVAQFNIDLPIDDARLKAFLKGDIGSGNSLWPAIQLTALALFERESDLVSARGMVRDAATLIIADLDKRSRDNPLALIIASTYERMILNVAMDTLAMETPLDRESANLALAIIEAVTRGIRSANSDTLALLAAARTSDEERLIHQLIRLSSRYNYEKELDLLRLLQRLSLSPTSDDTGLRYDTTEKLHLSRYGNRKLAIMKQFTAGIVSEERIPIFPTMESLQSKLLPNEVFVFITGYGNSAFHLCITNDDYQYTRSVYDESQFAQDLKLIDYSIRATHPLSLELDGQFPVESSRRLYDTVIGPILSCTEAGDTLLIAPYAPFDRVPVEVLLAEAPSRIGGRLQLARASWALERNPVAYVGSARFFVASRTRQRRSAGNLGVLGIGDPNFSALKDGSYYTANPVAKEGLLRSGPESVADYQPLPETRDELLELNSIAPGTLLLGDSATESDFRSSMPGNYRYLAFATHGVLSSELPGSAESALLLTPESSKDSFADGLLTASEIADMQLRADSVFLSACDTAAFEGNAYSADIRGLASAFATAGVPEAVVTLAPVETSTSRTIVTQAFSRIVGGQSASKSLAASKLKFLRNPPRPEFAHPRFWAPFVIYGISPDRGYLMPNDNVPIGTPTFHYVPLADQGEVTKLTLDSGRDQLIVNWCGNPAKDTGRLHTYLGAYDSSRTELWRWEDESIGCNSALALLPRVLVTGGYTGGIDGTTQVVLVGIDPRNGRELWRKEVGDEYTVNVPSNLVLLSDKRMLLAVSSKRESSEVQSEADLVFYSIDADGDANVLAKHSLGEHFWPPNIQLIGNGDIVHAIYTTQVRPTTALFNRLDSYGNVGCIPIGNETTIIAFLPKKRTVGRIKNHPRLLIRDGIVSDREGSLLVGSRHQECDLDMKQDVVFALSETGGLTELFAGDALLASEGSGISLYENGYLVVGGGDNILASGFRETVRDMDKLVEKMSESSSRLSASKQVDGFIMNLDAEGNVIYKIWEPAGGDTIFSEVVVFGEDIVIGGWTGTKAILGWSAAPMN